MKIAFLGNHDVSYSSETHHCQALEDLGHEVIRLQEGRATADEIAGTVRDSCALVVWVHTHGWDTPGGVDTALLEARRLGVPVITYHLDLWIGLARQEDMTTGPYWNLLDHFFTADRVMAEYLTYHTPIRGHYLPAAVSHRECYAVRAPRDLDVVFVGSHRYHPEWPYRQDLIGILGEHYGDRFHLFPGDGPAIRGRDLNLLYARTKVVVGDSLCLGYDYPYYWSDRVYETLGRGGFLIHPTITGLQTQFTDGAHLRYYDYGDFGQLFSLIDHYLENGEERESIRADGHAHTHRHHTYLHRWTTILDTLEL
jgi:hypothetical protein